MDTETGERFDILGAEISGLREFGKLQDAVNIGATKDSLQDSTIDGIKVDVKYLKKDVSELKLSNGLMQEKIHNIKSTIDKVEESVTDISTVMTKFIKDHDKDLIKFLFVIIPMIFLMLSATVGAVYWSNYHISQRSTDRYIQTMETKMESLKASEGTK